MIISNLAQAIIEVYTNLYVVLPPPKPWEKITRGHFFFVDELPDSSLEDGDSRGALAYAGIYGLDYV